jgi:hypothetical protein
MSTQMDELIAIMREMLKWTKFAGSKEVRNVLSAALDSDPKRLIYHLSDGNDGTVKIGEAAGVSGETVRKYWESWSRQGIVDPIKVQGGQRYKKSFDSEDFGIAVPEPKAKKQTTEEPALVSK